MGTHPEDGKRPGQFSIQGFEEAHREAAAVTDVLELVLTASGGGTGGSGNRCDKEVNNKENNMVAQYIATQPILLKPWETHITNRSHYQAFLITAHEKETHSHSHTCKQSLKKSR